MAVNIKNIILTMLFLAMVLNASNIENKNMVLRLLESNVKDSKKELSLRLNICFDNINNNPIIIDDINFIKNFKRKDVFSFSSHIYLENLTDCMQKKDYFYIYNLAMLYGAQKDYDMNATDTLEKLKNYFEPIEGLERRINYDDAPEELKKYLKNKLGNKLFDYGKAMKNVLKYYREQLNKE